MRITEESSTTLILYWPQNQYANCKFSDLFENQILEINTEEMERHSRQIREDGPYNIVKTWRLLTLPHDELPERFSRQMPSKIGRDIDLEYGRIPFPVRERLLCFLNTLVPKREIAAAVDEFSRRFNYKTVGISVRTWPEDRGRNALFSLKRVFAAMDKIDDASFFVSCDSQGVLDAIISRYKERILFSPKSTFSGDRNSREGMREILIDMLLLAKCRDLRVSYLSTFPEMAWWLGGCKAEVKIIPPKTFFFKRISIGEYLGYSILWKWYLT